MALEICRARLIQRWRLAEGVEDGTDGDVAEGVPVESVTEAMIEPGEDGELAQAEVPDSYETTVVDSLN
jgi:hypothetical protein